MRADGLVFVEWGFGLLYCGVHGRPGCWLGEVDEGRKQDAGSKQRMIPSSAEGQRERGDTFCHGSKPETLAGLGSRHSANRTRPNSALPLTARPHGIVFISARSDTPQSLK